MINLFYAQDLSPKALNRLQEVSKKNNDTINIKSPETIFNIGYWSSYFGMDDIGEELMQYGIRNVKNLKPELIRHSSVQNTKNGYWVQAIQKLEQSSTLDPSINAYYGWVLLFFYHDYSKSLEKLEKYEKYMKNEPNLIANGDNFHYLKGINYMQLNQYEKAINEFDWSKRESFELTKKNDFFPFQLELYKGRCFEKLGQLNKALDSYDESIKIAKVADNYFYKALVLKRLNRVKEYEKNIKISFDLIKQGKKNNDNYQVVFDEVYIQDIEKELNEITNKYNR